MSLVIPAFAGMIDTTVFDREKMAKAAPTGFSLATEIADFLVRAGIPFAKAHEAAGECVRECESTGRELHELSDDEFAAIHPALTAEVRNVLTVAGALASRVTFGGTAPAQLISQIATLESQIARNHSWITSEIKLFSGMTGP